jgi:hypothetical protein
MVMGKLLIGIVVVAAIALLIAFAVYAITL